MNTRERRRSIASFGVALSALAAANVAEGAVMDLTFNPTSVPYSGTATVTMGSVSIRLNSTGGVGTPGTLVGPYAVSFFAVNTATFRAIGSNTGLLTGFRLVNSGSLITNGMAFNSYVPFALTATGVRTVAFKTGSADGVGYAVGWIRVDLGAGGGSPMQFLAGAIQTDVFAPGVSSIVAGVGAVPEPSSGALFALGTLALGAAGVRRRRKKRVARAAAARV